MITLRASVIVLAVLASACTGPTPRPQNEHRPAVAAAPLADAPGPSHSQGAPDPTTVSDVAQVPEPVVEPASVVAPSTIPEPASAKAATAEVMPSPVPTPRNIEPSPAHAPVAAAKARQAGPARRPVGTVVKAAAPVAPKAAAGPATGSLGGRVSFVAGAGQSVVDARLADVAVYYVPDADHALPKPGRFTIYTHGKQFEPDSLVVPLGSTVAFPNQDEILHNVFSVTPASAFDLGLYGEGKSAEYTFRKTGLVLINCNVHHAMQANVLVVDTPFIVRPGADGAFTLAGLPVGAGKLVIWHPRGAIQSQDVRVPAEGPLELRMLLSKPRVVEHLNKERKPYRSAGG